MKVNFLKPLAAVVCAAALAGCTLPGEQVQDDGVLPGSYDTEPAKKEKVIINYEWALEPSINAENIIVFDGSQVDPDSSDYNDMYERYAIICQSGVYGFIDYKGNIVVQPEYKYYYIAPNGQMVLYNNLDEKGEEREYCTLDDEGEVTTEFYAPASPRIEYYYDEESGGIYYAEEAEDWTAHKYTDKKTVAAVKADVLDNGMSVEVVTPEPGTERYGMVNQDGIVLDFEYENYYAPRYKGMGITAVAFEKDGKWGYVDSKGKQILDFTCDEIFSSYNGENCDDQENGHPYLFSEEFVPVSINYSFGYYNMEGQCVVKSNEFSQARPVHHGKAWVSDGNAWGIIRFGEEEEEEEETTTTTTTTTAYKWDWDSSSADTTSSAPAITMTSPNPADYPDDSSAVDTDEPVYTDPVVTDPVYTDPIETDPIYTDPVVTDPIYTDPVPTDPVYTDPEPVYTDPIY